MNHISVLIWAQHAANKRIRTATSKVTKSVSIARWQGTQLVFDDYFLYFSAWVGDRVIHLFKDYLILNPLIVNSFFYVTYEAHSSLIKNKTHNLESNIYLGFMCTLSNAIIVAFQVMCILLNQAPVFPIDKVEKWFDYQWIQNSIIFKKMYDLITNSSRKIKKIVVKHKLRNLSTLNTYRFCDFWSCSSGPFISCMLSPN